MSNRQRFISGNRGNHLPTLMTLVDRKWLQVTLIVLIHESHSVVTVVLDLSEGLGESVTMAILAAGESMMDISCWMYKWWISWLQSQNMLFVKSKLLYKYSSTSDAVLSKIFPKSAWKLSLSRQVAQSVRPGPGWILSMQWKFFGRQWSERKDSWCGKAELQQQRQTWRTENMSHKKTWNDLWGQTKEVNMFLGSDDTCFN